VTLQDMRGQGAPADIGTFLLPTSVIVYQHTFSGVTYFVAARQGDRGWVLVSHGTVVSTVLQAAITEANAVAGKIFVKSATYLALATLTPLSNVTIEGEGAGTIFRVTDAAPNLFLTNVAIDSFHVRWIKIDLSTGTTVSCSGIVLLNNATNCSFEFIYFQGKSTVLATSDSCFDCIVDLAKDFSDTWIKNCRSNCYLIGAQRVNGLNVTECYVEFDPATTDVINAVYLAGCTDILIAHSVFKYSRHNGAFICNSGANLSSKIRFIGNHYVYCADGIELNTSVLDVTISANIFEDCGSGGDASIMLEGDCIDVTITGNVITGTSADWGCKGIYLHGAGATNNNVAIVGNTYITRYNTTHYFLIVETSMGVVVADNVINQPNYGGTAVATVQIINSKDVKIHGNLFDPAGGDDHAPIIKIESTNAGDTDSVWIQHNYFRPNIYGNAARESYIIQFADLNATNVWITGENHFGSSQVAFTVVNAPATVHFPSLILPFVDGTLFLSADGAPWGWEIDAAAEYAIALGLLPAVVQWVLKINVRAVSLVAEAHAMRLEINGYGGTDNEAFSQETIAVANKPSATINFAANDYIVWTLTPTDDADIGHLLGRDSVMFKVLHEAAGNGDCATDAVFLCVEIEYI